MTQLEHRPHGPVKVTIEAAGDVWTFTFADAAVSVDLTPIIVGGRERIAHGIRTCEVGRVAGVDGTIRLHALPSGATRDSYTVTKHPAAEKE